MAISDIIGGEYERLQRSPSQLSELIDRALSGETVVITGHGRAVVELKAIPEPARPVSPADLDWLAERRIGQAPAAEGARRATDKTAG